MKRMIIATLLAGSALTAAAAPALAQPGYGGGRGGYGGGQGGGGGYEMRLDRMEQRIERGVQTGDLTRRESFRLRSELRDQRITLNRYQRGGLSGYERQDLDRRLDMLQARLRFERRDGDERGDGRRGDRRGY